MLFFQKTIFVAKILASGRLYTTSWFQMYTLDLFNTRDLFGTMGGFRFRFKVRSPTNSRCHKFLKHLDVEATEVLQLIEVEEPLAKGQVVYIYPP